MADVVREMWTEDRDPISDLGRWTASFATLVGADVVRTLAEFANEAETGSSITITCDPEGFTAERPGVLVRGRPGLLSPERILALARALD